MSGPATAVYALTQQGAMTAKAIAAAMAVDIYVPPALLPGGGTKTFKSLRDLLAETFTAYRQHIFITSAGVAVQCIAPHIKSKIIDPAVVVLDHHGTYVVSLLSGYLGGANRLAREVAGILDGQAVITTATDVENVPSLDVLALECNMSITNVRAVATVNAAMRGGEAVIVDDLHNRLQLRMSAWEDLFIFTDTRAFAAIPPEEADAMPRVTVTPAYADIADHNLVLRPKVLHIGINCRRGVRADEILPLVDETLERLERAPASLASIAAPENKRYEPGLNEAAATLKVPLRFFTIDELNRALPASKKRGAPEEDKTCEAAALLAAGKDAALLAPGQAARSLSIAVAQEGQAG